MQCNIFYKGQLKSKQSFLSDALDETSLKGRYFISTEHKTITANVGVRYVINSNKVTLEARRSVREIIPNLENLKKSGTLQNYIFTYSDSGTYKTRTKELIEGIGLIGEEEAGKITFDISANLNQLITFDITSVDNSADESNEVALSDSSANLNQLIKLNLVFPSNRVFKSMQGKGTSIHIFWEYHYAK